METHPPSPRVRSLRLGTTGHIARNAHKDTTYGPQQKCPCGDQAKADSSPFRLFLPSANVDFQGAHRLRIAPTIGRRRDIIYWHKEGWTLVSHAERQSGKCRDRCGDGLTAPKDIDIRSNDSALQKHLRCHQHTLGTT